MWNPWGLDLLDHDHNPTSDQASVITGGSNAPFKVFTGCDAVT